MPEDLGECCYRLVRDGLADQVTLKRDVKEVRCLNHVTIQEQAIQTERNNSKCKGSETET